jgi:hypothetical protein
MLMLRATRRVATPGAAARPAEGVEMLDVAMAEYVSSPSGESRSRVYDQAS